MLDWGNFSGADNFRALYCISLWAKTNCMAYEVKDETSVFCCLLELLKVVARFDKLGILLH